MEIYKNQTGPLSVLPIILLAGFLTFANAKSTTIDNLSGEMNTLESDITTSSPNELESLLASSCKCSPNILKHYNQIKAELENYEESTVEALQGLRKQVAENKHELGNRSDKITNNKYYEALNRAIKYVNSDIASHKDVTNIKLSAYNNLLLLSNNGFIYKENNILNIYSEIMALEELENKIKTLINEQKE